MDGMLNVWFMSLQRGLQYMQSPDPLSYSWVGDPGLCSSTLSYHSPSLSLTYFFSYYISRPIGRVGITVLMLPFGTQRPSLAQQQKLITQSSCRILVSYFCIVQPMTSFFFNPSPRLTQSISPRPKGHLWSCSIPSLCSTSILRTPCYATRHIPLCAICARCEPGMPSTTGISHVFKW